MARLAPEDRFAGLAPRIGWRGLCPSWIWKTPHEPSAESLIERARSVEGAALAVKGVTNSEAAARLFRAAPWRSPPSTVSMAAMPHQPQIGVAVLAGEGTGMERDDDHATARHAGDLATPRNRPHAPAKRPVRRLNPRSAFPQAVPVVFDPREAAGLIGHFASAISGAGDRTRRLVPERPHGPSVFAPGIAIIDDPHRIRGLRSKPFDGEGVANQRRA